MVNVAFIDQAEYECFAEPWDERAIRSVTDDACGICVCMTGIGYALGKFVIDEAELYRIAVLPGQRRRGSGRKILGEFIEECRSKGVKTVFLEVRSKNGDAIALYEQSGFSRVGMRKNYYPDDDAVIYSLSL